MFPGCDKVPLNSLLLRGNRWQDHILPRGQLSVTLKVETLDGDTLNVLTFLDKAVDFTIESLMAFKLIGC